MDVRSDGAADRQAIRARLLLPYAPVRRAAAGSDDITADDIGPGDAGFHFQQSAILIEPAYAAQAAHVQQPCARQELLTAHRMAAAGNGQRGSLILGVPNRADDVLDGSAARSCAKSARDSGRSGCHSPRGAGVARLL